MNKIKILNKEFERGDIVEVQHRNSNFLEKEVGYLHISHKKTLWKRRKDFFHLTPLKHNDDLMQYHVPGIFLSEKDITSINKLVYERD